jgi:hypothetical protein
MEPMPEKLYYLPLPGPSSMRIPNVAFWTSARTMAEKCRWAARTQEAVVWMLTLVLALAVGALVGRV